MNREKIEWNQMYWADTDQPSLPRILLIGDSIVVGHRSQVAERMKNVATIGGFSTSKIVGDPAFYRELEVALSDYPVDLIYFNNGLHGLKCSDEAYRKGLTDLVEFLRINTRARLCWRSSTPITLRDHTETLSPDLNPVVLRRNRIAEEVMKHLHVPTDDLYSLMLDHPEYRSPDGFHYVDAGIQVQADHIAETLKKMLASRTLSLEINGFKTDYPGFVSDWCGYECLNFHLDGILCRLVKPNTTPSPEKRWYWRARFFGAFPNADWAMLDLGWYVAHIEINELYGSPESNRRFDMLYNFLTSIGFCKKCVPVGYSRGGLDVYSWAAKNPEKVSCLYLDNPVCDFKSWPGGKGKGPGSADGWKNCLKAWNFTEEQAMAYPDNPVDHLKELADAHVPILHLCSDADEVVPAEENTMLLEKRYRELGGPIEVIYRHGAKHHPHCLENPQPIVDFILKHSK